MQGVVQGFVTIALIIGLGAFLAHVRVVDLAGQQLLARLSFFVAGPALMVTMLSEADIATVFTANLGASVLAVLATAVVYLVLARVLWHRDVADTTIGALSSVYVNAANLGLPIATYVLGDAALVAPMLLVQLIVLLPVGLAVLDSTTAASRVTLGRSLRGMVTNPLTLGSLVGLLLSVTDVTLPTMVRAPLELVAAMAVPTMLIAYGVSLRLGPRPGSGDVSVSEIAVISSLKLVVQPTIAYLVARYAMGLEGNALLAVTVVAALPTAQNIFILASRYDRTVVLARDVIFVTTLGSAPVIFTIAALLA